MATDRPLTRPPGAVDGDVPARLLPALSDLQRHLEVLGDDLAAADRTLVAWQGRARDRFHHHVVVDLAHLADLLDDLRRVRLDLADEAPT